MRKKYILFALALGALTACDPCKDEADFDEINISAEQLLAGATFEQFSAVTNEDGSVSYSPAEDGNYIKYDIPSVSSVTISYIKSDGSESVLSTGSSGGMFTLLPARGSDPTQTVSFHALNSDGTTTEATKNFTVYVPTALSPEMRLLASDAYGHKVWTWDVDWFAEDVSKPEAVWGNLGYAAGDGDSFVNSGNGIWWGGAPEVLATPDQLKHSDTGVATGEEDRGAYMEFYDDGSILTYDAAGNQIRKGSYSVSNYTGERDSPSIDGSQANWSYGTLTTTAGSILFPFQINGGGNKPTDFEIMQLDANHLKLIYAAPGTGGWGEATWWAFKSVSDPDASLTGFGTKDWTWDVDWFAEDASKPEGIWGNLGYAAGDGDSFVNSGNGVWWGGAPELLATPDQIKHSDTGIATGEEDRGAYMTFNWANGTVETFDANGTKIRGGKFEIKNWGMGKRTQASIDGSQTSWAYGTLSTDAGSILFPFQINGGGNKPTDFEIMQLDADHMKLIYAAPGTGGWGEATWWAFKKK